MKNYVNPPGSPFSATVNGKPTGLAGCKTPCYLECLRKHRYLMPILVPDDGLDVMPVAIPLPDDGTCRFFIPTE